MAKIINGSTIYLALADYLATNAYINDTAQDVLIMVAKWIDEAPEVNAWIPVTERLPDVDGRYLCFHRGAYANWTQSVQFAKDARKFDEYAFKKRWENKWLLYDSEYGYYAVDSITHWMPLPEPPKEIEDG